jgi:hypothetical protein
MWKRDDWNSAEYITMFPNPEKVQNYYIPKENFLKQAGYVKHRRDYSNCIIKKSVSTLHCELELYRSAFV